MLTQVTLIGRLTKQPELRTSSGGKPFVAFTVACDGYTRDNTVFVPCFAWNKQAENLAKYLGKGSLVSVIGSLNARRNDSNRDGNNYESLFVTANRVIFLDKRGNTQQTSTNNFSGYDQTNPATQSVNSTPPSNDEGNNNDDEVSYANDKAIIWD